MRIDSFFRPADPDCPLAKYLIEMHSFLKAISQSLEAVESLEISPDHTGWDWAARFETLASSYQHVRYYAEFPKHIRGAVVGEAKSCWDHLTEILMQIGPHLDDREQALKAELLTGNQYDATQKALDQLAFLQVNAAGVRLSNDSNFEPPEYTYRKKYASLEEEISAARVFVCNAWKFVKPPQPELEGEQLPEWTIPLAPAQLEQIFGGVSASTVRNRLNEIRHRKVSKTRKKQLCIKSLREADEASFLRYEALRKEIGRPPEEKK